MESFVADLKKQVQCSLCNDTLIEPKMLPCFDTFCKPCIKRHAELIEEVNVFKCPKCKSQTSLPELSSVEDLQPSVLHSRMLKGLALVEGERVCSVSESHSTASWFCFDCDRSMCDECKKSHSEFNKDHKVVGLADLKKEDIEFIITRENPCTSHPQHRLELFCEDCDAMICRTCWINDHKDHKTMSLDTFASIKKAVLSQHLQVLEQLRSDDKEKQQQEKIANTIKQQGEKAKKEVQDKTNKIIQMLQENERKLLKQIDEKLDKATTNLNIIHHIPAVEEYIKNVMERGLASEMMNIQDTQCSQKFIFNHIPLSSRVEFVPNEQLVREVNSGLGEIRTCLKTDHTKSTIEVKSATEALKKEKLVLITKASTGELNHDKSEKLEQKLQHIQNVMEMKEKEFEMRLEKEKASALRGKLSYVEKLEQLQKASVEKDEQIKALKKQLNPGASDAQKPEKVTLKDFQCGDLILLIFDPRYENYLVFTTGTTLYFLHPESMGVLDIATSGNKRCDWMLAQLTDKEYCQAKKAHNRFHVPVGTKFYRIQAKQWER